MSILPDDNLIDRFFAQLVQPWFGGQSANMAVKGRDRLKPDVTRDLINARHAGQRAVASA